VLEVSSRVLSLEVCDAGSAATCDFEGRAVFKGFGVDSRLEGFD
jgi:hypothetical protein